MILRFCVLPMCVWTRSLRSMKGCELDGARVKEIRAVNARRREAAAQGLSVEEAMAKYLSGVKE